MLFTIAFRSILRERRRSLMTVLAIAVSAMAMTLFGEFVAFIRAGLETSAVESMGHLVIARKGYFDLGTGNPAAYGIRHYEGVMRLVRGAPDLAPKISLLTPTVTLMGIASNYDVDASKTFLGVGFIPSDRRRMRAWDEYALHPPEDDAATGLRDDDDSRAVIGVGLARILGLCDAMKLGQCPPVRVASATPAAAPSAGVDDLLALARSDRGPAAPQAAVSGPRIDLLAATAGGAPNVLSVNVAAAERQGARELDDAYVALHFGLAQRLLYGRGEPMAVGIVVQLQHTRDIPTVRARLESLFAQNGLDLEVRDFTELQPFYLQVLGMFAAIFLFIAVIMGVIVLFTVVNTMGMSVVERTSEIGTARALGLRQGGIRRMFLMEGGMLGAVGATVGLVAAEVAAVLFNRCGATWVPPGQASSTPLHVLTSGVGPLLVGTWIGLVVMATVAALVPANRAARLAVVDALRHV